MKRLVLAFVVAVALAGCGSDSVGGSAGTDGSPSAGSATTAASLPPYNADVACPPVDQFVGPEAFTTAIDLAPLKAGQGTTWNLSVTNVTTNPVVLAFGNGQSAEVTLSQNGHTAYTWSSARSFTQAIRCETVQPGTPLTIPLAEERPLPAAGEYDLRVVFYSTPLPPEINQKVTIAP
jgi:hypothetical protein